MKTTMVAWAVLVGLSGIPSAQEADSPAPSVEAADSGPTTGEPAPAPPEPAEPAAAPAAEPQPAPTAPEAVSPAATATRVRMELEARGELFAPAGQDAGTIRQPISVTARFDFTERPDDVAAVLREYAEATAAIRIDGREQEITLPPDARRVRVALQGTTPVPYLADAFLAREEADLLDTPFDAVLLDRLLPAEPVAVGAKWTVAADATAGMLSIDTVESGGLEAELTGVDDGLATVRLAGTIDGAVDGVPTHLVVEGECGAAGEPADRGERTTWRLTATRVAAVTLRERRQAGHVAPGFEVEARVAVSRRPAAAAGDAERAVPTDRASGRRRGEGRPGMVWHRDPADGFDLVCDARWRVVEDGPNGCVMRLVDRGALVGQCSLTALPRSDALVPPTIAEVQRDIERSLAGQFGRFEHASEATRSDGVRIVRVVSEGAAENLPFRWIHYVLSDASGRRAAATFMHEVSAAKRFADADRQLIDGLGFPATAASPPDREARAPRESLTP